jgi:hypothetical protein
LHLPALRTVPAQATPAAPCRLRAIKSQRFSSFYLEMLRPPAVFDAEMLVRERARSYYFKLAGKSRVWIDQWRKKV